MRIESGSAAELIVFGNIKSIEDYTALRTEVMKMVERGARDIAIRIPESFSMPSSVIGFLLKLKNRENIKLRMTIGDHRLYELLNDLSLVGEFGATLSRSTATT